MYSLYLHVPFCVHRCAYCDFNTYAGMESSIPAYVDALCAEIAAVAARAGERLAAHTVFFGGGTPSLLSSAQLAQVMDALARGFDLQAGAEITLEANPGTVTPQWLADLHAVGFNRLSFGMQSAHPDDLRALERQHNFLDVVQAVRWARQAGFDNLSVDLIFGLPEQTAARWQESLTRALALGIEHLSLYGLTIEHGTPLYRQYARGLIAAPDDDLAADMYEAAQEMLAQAGFVQYEISNWARVRAGVPLLSQHNAQYWRSGPYLGLGAGAHGFVPAADLPDGVLPEAGEAALRTANVGGVGPFIRRVQGQSQRAGDSGHFPSGPAARRVISLAAREAMQEYLLVGLRLLQEGVSARAFAARFGQALDAAFAPEIARLSQQGLLEWVEMGGVLRLTPRAVLVANRVFREFLSDS